MTFNWLSSVMPWQTRHYQANYPRLARRYRTFNFTADGTVAFFELEE